MEMREPIQARAHATRAKLVEAAAECLATAGYQATTTQSVAGRAGVSQGALFKHFPTKAALLAGCVADVLARLVEAFEADPALRAVSDAEAGDTPLDARISMAVRALFSVFRSAPMQAVFEVYVAARTDVTLGVSLTPILERHRENILRKAASIFPEVRDHEAFATAVDAVVYAMQGVTIGLFAGRREVSGRDASRGDEHHLAFFERLARHELAHALTEQATPLRDGAACRS